MCEKSNSSAQLKALSQAKQLEIALRTNFGEENLATAKLLLANPVFRVFIKMAGALTFESYVKRFFSIVASVSAVVNFHYFDTENSSEVSSFKFTDDVLNTGTHTTWHCIRKRLSDLGLLKAMALTLPIVSIYKITDRTYSELNMKFRKIFNRKQFDERVLPVIAARRPKTYALLAEAEEDEMLYLDFVFRCFSALRVMYMTGEIERGTVEPDDGLPELDLVSAISQLGKTSFRVPDDPTFAFIDVMIKQHPQYVALRHDGYIYVDVPFDPFTIIGGTHICFDQILKANFVLHNCEDQEVRAVLDGNRPVVLANPAEEGTPASFVTNNFGFDINLPAYSKLIYANDPDVEIAIKAMSKSSHQWSKKFLPEPRLIEEAIDEAAKLLRGKVQISDDKLVWVAAGRILSMKGNLRLDNGKISRK